jgi:hypothetical protein
MIDNDAYLMLTIFQKVLQPEGHGELGVDQFADQHKRELTEAGQVLIYLGLAWPSSTPTANLVGSRRTGS